MQIFGIFFTFFQSERLEMDAIGYTVVQTSMVAEDVIDNPRGGRATDDKQNVFSSRSVAIPKMFKCRYKTGTWRIHPRKFVNEYYFLSFGFTVL